MHNVSQHRQNNVRLFRFCLQSFVYRIKIVQITAFFGQMQKFRRHCMHGSFSQIRYNTKMGWNKTEIALCVCCGFSHAGQIAFDVAP